MTVIVALVVLMTMILSLPQARHFSDSEGRLATSVPSAAAPNEINALCNDEAVHAECYLTAILPGLDISGGDYLSGTSEYVHDVLATAIVLNLNLPPPRA